MADLFHEIHEDTSLIDNSIIETRVFENSQADFFCGGPNCIDLDSQPDDELDELKLKCLMQEFNLEIVMPYLKASQITYRSLQYLSKEDIYRAIPPLGLQAEFREKLFFWRKAKYNEDDDTLSVNTKTKEWLEKSIDSETTPPTQSSSSSVTATTGNSYAFLTDIEKLLNTSNNRQIVKTFYQENGKLQDTHRQEIIRILIEAVNNNNIHLKPCDFLNITKQITEIFPTEKSMKDYYFIGRGHRQNPRGKLYNKYVNTRAKRRKLSTSVFGQNIPLENLQKDQEVDETISGAIKTFLKRDNTNWEDICDKWEKTFQCRQRDLNAKDTTLFLLEWPKYKHSRAPDLIEIDFKLQYPNKHLLLISKWDNFKIKIKPYYTNFIINPCCKQMFKKINNDTNIDSEDVILATLLNSVLLPTARFKDKLSKINRKVTIIDAQESFILHLSTLNNYENKIEELTNKYYNIGLTLQPFIIVVGGEITNIKKFYIFFDKTLFEYNSFIECFDSCFKLFQTLNLQYPRACIHVWNFIQKYFYQIDTKYDTNSPSLANLLNYLKD